MYRVIKNVFTNFGNGFLALIQGKASTHTFAKTEQFHGLHVLSATVLCMIIYGAMKNNWLRKQTFLMKVCSMNLLFQVAVRTKRLILGKEQAMELVHISEYVCEIFFPLFLE